MAKFKNYIGWLAFYLVVLVCMMQGSMVRAENAQNLTNQDRFVGFHIVAGTRNQDRSQWVEYGENVIDTGDFGTLSFPHLVLFGEYQEETGEWVFPGMPGSNAFYTTVGVGEERLSSGYAGLDADVEVAFSSHLAQPYAHTLESADATVTSLVDETRDSISLSGTVYLPATKGDVYVTYYRVYETEDGRIYLDGSGNSSSSEGTGSGFGMYSSEEEVVAVNSNETYTVTTAVAVQIEFVHPCISLILLEYNAENECVASTSLAAQDQEFTLRPDTTWCVVQEINAADEQRQTALSVVDAGDDNALYHGFVVETADEIIQLNHLDINVS